MNDSHFDVAFSFLKEDVKTAEAFRTALAPMLSCFVYSRDQEQVAGTDGLETFGTMFRERSKLNVILYRQRYGQTPWTQFEESVIKQRLFDEGWETLLFIRMDKDAALPKWIPGPYIHHEFSLYGFNETIGVIRARTFDRGAIPKIESAVQRTRRLAQERDSARKRESILNSVQGVEIARTLRRELFHEIATQGACIKEADAELNVLWGSDENTAVVHVNGFSLTLYWEQPIINSLQHTAMATRWFRGYIPIPGQGNRHGREVECVGEATAVIDVDDEGGYWRLRGDKYSAASLAEYVLGWLVQYHHTPPRKKAHRRVIHRGIEF